MEQVNTSPSPVQGDISGPELPRSADHWQRRFGVPWDRVDRAARAVLERAAAASKRRYAELNGGSISTSAYPG